jgi:hypothetical protein
MPEQASLTDLTNQLCQISKLIDQSGTIESVVTQAATADSPVAADATTKLVFTSAQDVPMFVTVSGDGNPDLVARATRNIKKVRRQLSERYAEPVVEPLEAGMVLGRSFAVWPMLDQFPQGRVPRYLAKRRIRPNVLDWLSGILDETHIQTNADDRRLIATNLALLYDDRRHQDHVRRAAESAADSLASGRWVPVHCVQHSDLWMGNIMIAPAGSSMSFTLVDWAGATTTGYPFFDLCRFAISNNTPSRLIKKHVACQLRRLDSNSNRIGFNVLCALGQMQSRLEHFPESLFRKMALETTNFSLNLSEEMRQ